MMKIAVITDSDASLPPELAAQYGVHQVPITIHFGDEGYTTGVDIDDAKLFKLVDKLNRLPTTSAPSPHAFAEAYEKAFQSGAESILCICVSSKVSATYAAAVNASEMFPGRDITVIDSLTLSMAQGFMVMAAVEAIRAGATKEQAAQVALDTGSRTYLYAVLATLKYLALSGRVGKVAAGMADTLNIKPLLTMKDGKLDMLERVRTRRKAIDRMLALTRESLGGRAIERASIVHINHPQGAKELREQLCALVPCPENVIISEFTPGLSVHAGSGVVGLAVVACKQ